MIIKKISLKDFRNIENTVIEPDEHINVIYGENANGKTNVLEGIYILKTGRSFRPGKDANIKRFGCNTKDGAVSEINFSTPFDDYCGKITVSDEKNYYLNGIKKDKIDCISKYYPAVIFTPDDMNLIKESPSVRRTFLDSGLQSLKGGFFGILNQYQKALEQRNALLKSIKLNASPQNMLDTYDRYISFYGSKIIYQRDRYIESLSKYASKLYEGISSGKEKIEIRMEKNVDESQSSEKINELMLKKLIESREKDISAGSTGIGPHRDDMQIFINGKYAKDFASQGQQRSVIIALKLAQAYVTDEIYGDAPVILFDDVLSELDENRQKFVLNNIDYFQVFITCCDPQNVLRLKQGKTFRIKEGKII